MIAILDHPSGYVVNSIDLYFCLGLNASHYDRWMDDNLVGLSDLEEDYFNVDLKRSKIGRPRREYLVTLEASKTMCLLAKTKKALELRRWLINYQIEDYMQK